MEYVSNTITIALPSYLNNLPIPNSFLGWFKLGVTDWARLVPFTAAVAGVSWLGYQVLSPTSTLNMKAKSNIVNPSVKKDADKVVDSCDIEDISDKAVFCRCWRSKKFPYCDGSHIQHNKETGDNVGPLIVKRKTK